MSATGQTAVAKKENTFPAMLTQFKGEIERALPKHLNADRMTRIALTEFRKNPALGKCDPKSVFASIIVASQLGIEPGVLGQGYLIPYKNECQFVPGWQGLSDLVARAGRASVWTGAVFDGDEFEYALGDRPYLTHRPRGEDDPNKLMWVYAIGRIKGAEWPVIEVWTADRVERHRDRFNKVGDRHYSYNHFEMYARKVVLLQVLKYMPKSVELQLATDLEHAAQKGKQGINIQDAVDGTWAPSPENEEASEDDAGSRSASMKDKLRGGALEAKFDVKSGIESIKKQKSEAETIAAYDVVKADFAATGRDLPVEIEAAKNDHLAALKQL
jgi:recombination protein RecT